MRQKKTMISFPDYAKHLFKIRDKSRALVPFILNPPQMVVWAAIQRQMDKGLPIRIRVLKARQTGISLLSQNFALWWTINNEAHQVLSIANRLDLPAQWIRQLKRLLRQLKEQIRNPPIAKYSNRSELFFENLDGSRYMIGSALGETPGMGDTLNGVHCSEIASWPNPDAILGDLLPALPPTKHTFVLQESTGRALGDWWFQRYYEAKEEDCEYDCVFLPWYLSPEYNQDIREDRDDDDPNKQNRYTWDDLGGWENLDNDEKATLGCAKRYQNVIKDLYDMPDITPGQMMWRRNMLLSEFHGNKALFANQFPANETEAFLAEGENVFTLEQVRVARDTQREPIARYDLDWSGWHPRTMKFFRNDDSGEFRVWEEVDDRYHYVVGADCQWGATRDTDFDTLFVQCLETDKVVARCKGRYDMADWAHIIAGVGYHYNTAKIAPERNSKAATGVMPVLLGRASKWKYPNIYVRKSHKGLSVTGGKEWGWLTDEHTKGLLVSHAKTRTIRSEGEIEHDQFQPISPLHLDCMDWCDEETIDEMRAYIWNERRQMTAPAGAHDDLLMARMITERVAQETKPNVDLYIPKEKDVQVFAFTSPHSRMQALADGTYEDEWDDEEW